MIAAGELEALASLAEGFMVSQVEIWRFTIPSPSSGWDDSTDEGIDEDSDPDVVVRGWFRNQPDHQLSDALAALAHNEDGRLFVPLGTTLYRRDLVRVTSLDEDGNPAGEGETFRVIDTNATNTWRVLVRASLMRLA